MSRLAGLLLAATTAAGAATVSSAQGNPDYSELNRIDTTRVSISVQNDCKGDLSDQRTAMKCFQTSAWQMYDFASTTQMKIRDSGLPAGMTFPASHVIEYGCLEEARELGRPYEFAGIVDLRDRVAGMMNSCNEALRVAETLSQDIRGDFAIVFNYGTLNTLASHTEWLEGIRPELLDVQEIQQEPDIN